MYHATRRHALKALGASLGLSFLNNTTLASSTRSSKRMIFVHAQGGWDPLAVFAPQFDDPLIQMESEADRITIGDFKLVDGPGRPSVVEFFRLFGSRSVVLNGLSTRSVNHETCEAVALTGSTSTHKPDWATLIAASRSEEVVLPHLSISGPLLSGDLGVYVSRAQGSLQSLLSGELLEEGEPYAETLPCHLKASVMRHIRRRAFTLAEQNQSRSMVDVRETVKRAHQLLQRREELQFEVGETLVEQVDTAVRALSLGLSHCATLSSGGDWDTHQDNREQNTLYETLFSGLIHLTQALDRTLGPDGVPLSETTMVVVLSEMGRTPQFNVTGGRDHWPFTSALLMGEGIYGGQIIGSYREGFTGLGVDPHSLRLDEQKIGISAEQLGATLLTLGGIESAEIFPHVDPLFGLIKT